MTLLLTQVKGRRCDSPPPQSQNVIWPAHEPRSPPNLKVAACLAVCVCVFLSPIAHNQIRHRFWAKISYDYYKIMGGWREQIHTERIMLEGREEICNSKEVTIYREKILE